MSRLLIRDLAEGSRRFCELERSLEGISPRTLSLRLRALEDHGIVERHTFPEVPPRVQYALTDKGTALLVKSSDPIELSGLCDRVLVMSRGQIIEEIPGDELNELRIVEAMVRGPGLSRAGRSPLGVAMPRSPSSNGTT